MLKRYTKQTALINETAFLLYTDHISSMYIILLLSEKKKKNNPQQKYPQEPKENQRGPQAKETSDYNSIVQNCILGLMKI